MRNIMLVVGLLFTSSLMAMDETDQFKEKKKLGLVFIVHQKTLPKAANLLWDGIRAGRAWANTCYGNYDHTYVVQGEDAVDVDHMTEIWNKALAENDYVDYVSHVHGGDQYLTNYPAIAESKKLRLVYSEACAGTETYGDFLNNYNAWISIGHVSQKSASPFFSSKFEEAFWGGKNLSEALSEAWKGCCEDLNSDWGLWVVKKFGIDSSEQAIEVTKVKMLHREFIDPKNFYFNSVDFDFSNNGISAEVEVDQITPTL